MRYKYVEIAVCIGLCCCIVRLAVNNRRICTDRTYCDICTLYSLIGGTVVYINSFAALCSQGLRRSDNASVNYRIGQSVIYRHKVIFYRCRLVLHLKTETVADMDSVYLLIAFFDILCIIVIYPYTGIAVLKLCNKIYRVTCGKVVDGIICNIAYTHCFCFFCIVFFNIFCIWLLNMAVKCRRFINSIE